MLLSLPPHPVSSRAHPWVGVGPDPAEQERVTCLCFPGSRGHQREAITFPRRLPVSAGHGMLRG